MIRHYKNVAMWGDTYYHVTIDGDRHYLQYRKDLLDNPDFKSEFKAKYNKELEVPTTWKELAGIAEFFNGKKLSNGKIIYGIAEITNKDDLLAFQFIKRAAPYAKHPDVKGGFFFDLETMKPLINTPGFVEALKDFVAVQHLYPQGGTNFGLADVIMSFGKGETVFSDCWDDPFIQAMEKESGIRNQVAASLSPGSKKVWNRKNGKWDDFPGVNYVPYIATGWTSGVAQAGKHKQVAFDYLGFFANDRNHFSDLLVGRYGVNPFRKSDIKKEFWVQKAGWAEDVADSYVGTLSKMSQSKNRVLDLRIHHARQYMRALATGVYRALTGRDSPQDALDVVAQKWDELNKRVGIDKQREAYSHIVKFEDNQ